MKKVTSVVIACVALVGGYWAGYATAHRRLESASLAHALEKTALCANGLRTLTDDRQRTAEALLASQLRTAVTSAEELVAAGATIDAPIPNLIDGVHRARQYSDRTGDIELSKRLTLLHERLAERAKRGD